jgi:dolichyl-diphosphooligosaccharide--protein glycosyltransferase
MIGVHAGLLVLLGRFNHKVWAAYSLFYMFGTMMAMQIPVVGWTPLKSLEQLGPCAVFLGYQVLKVCDIIRVRDNLSRAQAWRLRIRVFSGCGAVVLIIICLLAPKGYFGPISSRVRSLFVQHTKTGNPLVDSVAEHQPASSRAYFQYLHYVCTLAPVGYIMVFFHLSDSSSFLISWGTAAYFFSHKMVRLVLLTAPIGSILGGIAAGRIFAWCILQWWQNEETVKKDSEEDGANASSKSKDAKKGRKSVKKPTSSNNANGFEGLVVVREAAVTALATKEGILLKRTLALVLVIMGYIVGVAFVRYSFRIAIDLSNPSIMFMARDNNNQVIKVDDYREAYWWLNKNTPEDSRIMAWWDYGVSYVDGRDHLLTRSHTMLTLYHS